MTEINNKEAKPKIDPKDYVFSQETIDSLTELAMLVKEVRARQKMADKEADREQIN